MWIRSRSGTLVNSDCLVSIAPDNRGHANACTIHGDHFTLPMGDTPFDGSVIANHLPDVVALQVVVDVSPELGPEGEVTVNEVPVVGWIVPSIIDGSLPPSDYAAPILADDAGKNWALYDRRSGQCWNQFTRWMSREHYINDAVAEARCRSGRETLEPDA